MKLFKSLIAMVFGLSIAFGASAAETGLASGTEYMTLKVQKNNSNPIKSGDIKISWLKKGDKFFAIGSYSVKKKWWLPIRKNDTLTDRELPAVIADYDKLSELVVELDRTQSKKKSISGIGNVTYLGQSVVNGVLCKNIKIDGDIGRINLSVSTEEQLSNQGFNGSVFVKIDVDAKLPILGKKHFILDLKGISHK